MKPGVIAAIVVAILVAVGAFVFVGSEETTDTDSNANQTAQVNDDASETETNASEAEGADQMQSDDEDSTENEAGAITAAMVAEHSTEEDCWTIVDGSVYDITSYIPRHPGGPAILMACGADGTSLFQNRTTEDGQTVGSGTPHSNNAANALADFKIGDLSQ